MFDRKNLRDCIAENMGALFSLSTAVVWCLAMLVAVVAGPFGTFEAMDSGQRGLFWCVIISVSMVLGYMMRGLAILLVGHDRPVLFDLVATLGMTAGFTPILWLFSSYFSTRSGVEMPGIADQLLYVFVISLGVYVLRRLAPGIEPTTYAFLQQESGSVTLAEEVAEPRLLRRLSPDIQAPVLRLSANDHHVEVVTKRGSEVLRLRFADAIDEMEPELGLRPHRSHWVAVSAVKKAVRGEKNKLFLLLDNGEQVPVSRSYRAEVEQMGLVVPEVETSDSQQEKPPSSAAMSTGIPTARNMDRRFNSISL